MIPHASASCFWDIPHVNSEQVLLEFDGYKTGMLLLFIRINGGTQNFQNKDFASSPTFSWNMFIWLSIIQISNLVTEFHPFFHLHVELTGYSLVTHNLARNQYVFYNEYH